MEGFLSELSDVAEAEPEGEEEEPGEELMDEQ